MKEVTIIGSGIIGVCAAYYLNQAGVAVRIIDQIKEDDENCSFGNAGMIVPSHFVPLSAPGIIKKGLKWMLNSNSPFYVKPKFNGELLKWIWQFQKHATEAHVENSSRLLHDLNRISNDLYDEINKAKLFEFEYERKGLMMLYQSDKCGHEELKLAEKAKSFGMKVEHLTAEKVNNVQQTNLRVKGGVLYPEDGQLNPNVFMRGMRNYLKTVGVQFNWETAVQEITVEKNEVRSLKTNKGNFEIDHLIVATGSWTPKLTGALGMNIPIQAGKGYYFNIDRGASKLTIPSILCEAKVAVTPFADKIRYAGTLGIEGLSLEKNEKRIAAFKNSIPNFFPDTDVDQIKRSVAHAGLRPCSPDGLPFIGRARQENVIIAAGHAMMGMSLGPITGKLVTEIYTDTKTTLQIDQLSPARYS
jgi:D-amino-acid dehydrogenase